MPPVHAHKTKRNRAILRAFYFTVVLLISGCGDKLCENSRISDSASENKKNIATVFDRNCGATTSIIRIVALRKAGEDFDPEKSKNWVLTLHGQPKVDLVWLNSDHLKIRYVGYVESKSSLEEWHGLKISIVSQ